MIAEDLGTVDKTDQNDIVRIGQIIIVEKCRFKPSKTFITENIVEYPNVQSGNA